MKPDEIKEIVGANQKLHETVHMLAKDAQTNVEVKQENGHTQFVFKKLPDGTVIVHRYVWAGGVASELISISRTPKFLNIVKQLFGGVETADQPILSMHPKPEMSPEISGHEVSFGAHRDLENRRAYYKCGLMDRYKGDPNTPVWENTNGDLSYLVFCIAGTRCISSEDQDPNGGLWGVPGSHKDAYKHVALKAFTPEAREALEYYKDLIVPLEQEPGDVILMHQNFVHGSYANKSMKDPRILLISGWSYLGANRQKYPGVGEVPTISLIDGSAIK